MDQVNQLLILIIESGISPLIAIRSDVEILKYHWLQKFLKKLVNTDNTLAIMTNQVLSALKILNWPLAQWPLLLACFDRANTLAEINELLSLLINYSVDTSAVLVVLQTQDSLMPVALTNKVKQQLLINCVESLYDQLLLRDNSASQEGYDLSMSIDTSICYLISIGWQFESLYGCLMHLKEQTAQTEQLEIKYYRSLTNSLFLVTQYKIPEQVFYDFYQRCPTEQLADALYNQWVRKQCFSALGDEPEIPELIKRINQSALTNIKTITDNEEKETSSTINVVLDETNAQQLLNEAQEIFSGNKVTPLVAEVSANTPPAEWDKNHIQAWASKMRMALKNKNDISPYLPEIIAVIRRACFLHYQFQPRNTQLLALLVWLQANPGYGRFVQVETGKANPLLLPCWSPSNFYAV